MPSGSIMQAVSMTEFARVMLTPGLERVSSAAKGEGCGAERGRGGKAGRRGQALTRRHTAPPRALTNGSQ